MILELLQKIETSINQGDGFGVIGANFYFWSSRLIEKDNTTFLNSLKFDMSGMIGIPLENWDLYYSFCVPLSDNIKVSNTYYVTYDNFYFDPVNYRDTINRKKTIQNLKYITENLEINDVSDDTLVKYLEELISDIKKENFKKEVIR